MLNVWKCNGNIQHLQKSGGIGAHLFQSCLLLFVNISIISLLGKGFAPLRCTRTVEAPWGLWMGYGCCMLMGRAASASHWQYDLLYVIALRCCGQAVGNMSQAVWLARFYSSSNEGGMHLTGTLFLHLLVEITMWNASQEYSMCLSHPRITAAFNVTWNWSLLCLA